MTRLSEQVMPFQDCPQGSSPFAGQPSWDGEFIPLNIALKAEAASNIQKQDPSISEHDIFSKCHKEDYWIRV